MKNIKLLSLIVATIVLASCSSLKIAYVHIFVPEEGSTNFTKITDESIETLVNPSVEKNYSTNRLTWWANPTICISNDGQTIAYNVFKNDRRNIFIRPVTGRGTSIQRTFRSRVNDLTFSPDGETICFSEVEGRNSYIYTTSAQQGYIVQRVSPQNVSDYGPCYSKDGSKIFFTRLDGLSFSIWSYDIEKLSFTNYCHGVNPVPINEEEFFCVRTNSRGNSEIWKVNYVKGTESIILSSENQGYTTPSISPDGKWILLQANTLPNGNKNQENLDIYVVRIDGSGLTQLTYHKGHDCSPVWGKDGKSIYFLSQRGTEKGDYNIWKMDFNLK